MKKSMNTTRQIMAMETKAKIFLTAKQLFLERGFENVSVDTIVEKAGVAKGSFYVHFESKNALITSLIADIINSLDRNYRSYLQSFPPGTSSSEIFLSFADRIADILADTIGHEILKIAYETLLTHNVNTSPITTYDRELYKVFNELIEQGILQGEFQSEKSTDTIAKHCVLGMRGLTYEWCVRYPDFNLKEAYLNHFELLLYGIKNKSCSK